MAMAAAIAATEPRKSRSTCSIAPLMFTWSRSPFMSIQSTPAFTAKPTQAMTSIGPARIGVGLMMRKIAS